MRKASATLAKIPGVMGVFWGLPTRKGRVETAPALIVYVRWKRTLAEIAKHERIPKTIGAFPIDVIEVGVPRAHAFDHEDPIVASIGRRSAISVLAASGGGAVGLVCGHGSLPASSGAIKRSYPQGSTGAPSVLAIDTNGPTRHGDLQRGSIGGATDYGLLVFQDAPPSDTDDEHYAVGKRPPLTIRTSPLSNGDPVRQISTVRRKKITGLVSGVSVHSVTLRLPDGSQAVYTNVFSISKIDEPFSIEGDSGSLIVDDDRLVVGTVLGSSDDGSIAFALEIGPLIDELGDDAATFFATE